jgi:hypothetical protein
MGAELMIQFGKGEKKKVKELMTSLLGEPENNIWGLEVDIGGGVTAVWIQEKGTTGFEIAYSFSGYGSELATALAAKLGKEFKVKKYGWDSVGYLTAKEVKEQPLANLKPFRVLIESFEGLLELQTTPAQKLRVRKELGFLLGLQGELIEKMEGLF